MPRYDSSMTEERVVEMRIDNDNFEKGAKETISTLEKLERALKIKGDSSAIDDMSKAVNKFDASPMAESFDVAVKSISNKAAFLQGVFNELGRDIYNFSKQVVKDVVTEPINEGMDKYTTLAETTQTLMAATKDYYIDLGITDENKQLEELTKQLDMLQWYSDETSYSFNDMADAVAKFVAAGVPIDQASQAIVGIATASAAAGANAKAASHTMQYAWAQAFGTGYMALGDFKTLENQNIATKEFKQNLLEIAADMGKISRVAKDGTDAFDDFYSTIIDPSRYDDAGYILKLSEKEEAAMFNWKNMRESLKEKWMDTDVMTEFANRYGEFSARLYDLVSAVRENGGDLEVSEARDLLEHFREVGKEDSAYWKDAADNLGLTVDELFKYLDALNNVEWKISETGFYMGQEYKTWQDVLDATRDAVSSQWMKTFQHIFGDFIEAKKLWTEVGELFYDAFVSWNITRNNILKEWHNKGGREALLGLEEDANGFRGALWNIVDAVRSVVGPITEGFAQAFGLDDTHGFAQKLIELTKSFREWTTELGLSEAAMAGLKDFASDVFSLISLLAKGIGWLVTLVGNLYSKVIHPIIDLTFQVYKVIHDFVADLINVLTGKTTVGDFIDNLLTNLIGVGESGFKYWTKASEWFTKIGDMISNAYDKIKSFFSGKTDLPKLITSLGKSAFGVFPEEKVTSAFNKLSSSIKKSFPVIEEFKKKLAFLDANKEGSGFNKFQNILKAIQWTAVGAFDTIKQKLATLGIDLDPIASKFQSIFDKIKMKAESFFGPIIDRIEEFKRRFETLGRNKDLTTFGRVFYALQGTARTAFREVNKGLQDFISKHPMLQEFFDMFKGVSFTDMLASVKDALVNFGSLVSEWFGPIGEKISGFYETVKSAFGKLGEDLSTLWTKMKEGMTFQDIADTIVNAFKDFGSAFDSWFEPIKQAISTKINDFVNWLEEIKPQLSEKWQSFIDFLIALIPSLGKNAATAIQTDRALDSSDGGMFSWLPEAIQNALDFILEPIERIITNFQNALAQLPPIDWNGFINQILKFGELAVSFAGVKAGLSVFKGLKQIGNGFKEFGKSIKEFAQNKTVTKNLEALTKGLADFFGNGKQSINSLFDAIKNTLKNGFTIKHKKYDSIGTTILKITASLAILVGALYVLTKLPIEDVKRALTWLAEIAGGMVVLAGAFAALGAAGFDGKPMLRMAISLGLIIAALWVVTKFPFNQFYKGLIRIGLLLAELAAFSRFSGSKLEFNNAPYIKMAISLVILMNPLKKLAKMDTASMLKGIIGLGAIMFELAAFSRIANTGLKTGGFIKMAIAVGLLTIIMKSIAKMDIGSLAKGLIGIGVLMVEFGNLIRKVGGFDRTKGVLSMAISIGILVFAMKKIADMDLFGILKGLIVLKVIMSTFGNMIKNIKGLSIGSGIMALIVIAGLLVGLYFAFKYLNEQDTDFTNVLKFTTAVAEVAISCGYMIKSLAPVPFMAGIKGIGLFAAFIAAVLVIVMILGGLRQMFLHFGMGDMLTTIQDGSEVLIACSEALGGMVGAFINGIWNKMTGGFNLAKLGTDLSDFMTNIQGFVTGAESLKGVDFSGIGKLTGAILEMAAADFVSAVVSLFTGKGTLAAFQGNVSALARCLNSFASNMSGITDCSGDIDYAISAAKGLVELTNSLPPTGGFIQKILGYKDLGAFSIRIGTLGNALKSYTTSISGITSNSEDIEAAKNAAMGLSELNNSLPDTGGKLQKWTGSKDLGAFGIRIGTVGRGLKDYAIAISGISGLLNEGDTSTASEAAKGLSDLQNSLPDTGGKLQNWLGSKNLKTFGDDLDDLGEGLKDYAIAISGISSAADTVDIDRAIEIATGLNGLNTALPPTGGILHDWLLGNQDLKTFGDNAKSFGESITDYAISIKGLSENVSEDDLQKAITIGAHLNEFQQTLPDVGGLVAWITGEKQDLGSFADNVGLLGKGLKTYADSIQGIEDAPADTALTILGNIKAFVDGLEKNGGIINAIDKAIHGDKFKTITEYASTMKTVGDDLVAFSDSMSLVSASNFSSATTLLKSIQEFVDGFEAESLKDKFIAIFSGSSFSTLDSVMDDFVTFGKKFVKVSNSLSGAATALTEFESAKALITSFKALQNESGDITGNTIISEADITNITTLATQIPQAMAEGITSNVSAYNNALNNMLNEGYSVFNYAEQNMYTIGVNLDTGLANGIYANASAPINAMAEVANAVVETAANATEVASPSRVFMRIGDYLDQGLSLGISQNASGPIGSIETLGDNLIAAMQDAMMQVSTIANGQFDFQPQITPVVDLSNVRAGASEYTRLFGGSIYSSMNGSIARNMSAAQSAQSAYNNMLQNTPQGNTSPDSGITVNVYANEGQSEQSIADAVVNRISAKSIRRSVAFG